MTFSQDQIDNLSSMNYINRVDDHLKIVSGIQVIHSKDPAMMRVILALEIFYDSDKIDNLSFDLHNYDYEEIVEIARDIGSNEFIMHEVDMLLAGEGE